MRFPQNVLVGDERVVRHLHPHWATVLWPAVIAAVLVVHIVLSVAGANPVNPITVFFRDWAAQLSLGLGDRFVPANESLRILLNFGLAALIWMVIGIVVVKLLRAISP